MAHAAHTIEPVGNLLNLLSHGCTHLICNEFMYSNSFNNNNIIGNLRVAQ